MYCTCARLAAHDTPGQKSLLLLLSSWPAEGRASAPTPRVPCPVYLINVADSREGGSLYDFIAAVVVAVRHIHTPRRRPAIYYIITYYYTRRLHRHTHTCTNIRKSTHTRAHIYTHTPTPPRKTTRERIALFCGRAPTVKPAAAAPHTSVAYWSYYSCGAAAR